MTVGVGAAAYRLLAACQQELDACLAKLPGARCIEVVALLNLEEGAVRKLGRERTRIAEHRVEASRRNENRLGGE